MDVREILRQLQAGESNRAIGAALAIDRKTIARQQFPFWDCLLPIYKSVGAENGAADC